MNYCQTCKNFVVPSWDTGGFGTCYLPSARKDKKLYPVLRGNPEGAWVGVHKTFSCPYHEVKGETNE